MLLQLDDDGKDNGFQLLFIEGTDSESSVWTVTSELRNGLNQNELAYVILSLNAKFETLTQINGPFIRSFEFFKDAYIKVYLRQTTRRTFSTDIYCNKCSFLHAYYVSIFFPAKWKKSVGRGKKKHLNVNLKQ